MSRNSSKLTAISYISINGNKPVRFDSLSPELKKDCIEKMIANVSKALSDYLSNHPDEAFKFIISK